MKIRTTLLLIALILLISSSVFTQITDVRMYTFGHSLIDHRPPLIPTPSDETTVLHWMNDIAQATGNDFATGGQYGFLTSHDDVLPPASQWGYDNISAVWDETMESFADADINTILITAANFIQYEPPSNPHPLDANTTVIEATETIFDWVNQQESDVRYYIYGNWPEMDLQSAFPPTPPLQSEIDDFHDVTIGAFSDWWIDYQDALLASRPQLNTRLIPVGPIISKILRDEIPGQIPFSEMYEDSSPHGRASLYFLAGMITYMAVYGEQIPNTYMPDNIVHQVIRDNLSTLSNFAWTALNDFNLPSGESRVFFPVSNVYYVSNNGDDTHSGLSLVDAFLTLQHASDVTIAGDQVLVEDGTYVGFDHRNSSGTSTSPIEFKAMGSNALINQSGPIRDDGINIEGADYIILDGFTCNNMPGSGNGIRVVLADNCIVRNCHCDNNGERGIFTAFTDDILIENNVCTNSIDEHGIYVSNSSDRPIIRYNECYGNNNIGIHMNGDLSSGGDGIISDAKVYGNILHDNNQAAGLNMDGVVNAEVYNNLIYNNHSAQGIALFQADGAVPTSGIKIYNNTIIVPDDGRWGILVQPGSNVNTEIVNNIIINEHAWRGCIAVSNLTNFTSDYNILNDKMSGSGDGSTITLAQWQALGQDANSLLADTPSAIFMNFGNNDFHLKANSQAIDNGTGGVNMVVNDDIEGVSRPAGVLFDIGAYEYQTALAAYEEEAFGAEIKNGQVVLKWSVNEINNSHFEISKSTNIYSWQKLANVASHNNAHTHAYQYIDTQLTDGVIYYKLIAKDTDGTLTNLGTISIFIEKLDLITIYPNPARDFIVISGIQGDYTREQYLMYNESLEMIKAGNLINNQIEMKELKSGIYYLQLYIDNNSIVKKIVKY